MKKSILFLLAALLLVSALSACSQVSAHAAPDSGDGRARPSVCGQLQV